MNQDLTHVGIVLSNSVDKTNFIKTTLLDRNKGKLPPFEDKKGVLFSDLAIAQFIEKEYRHQSVEVSVSEKRQLQTFSSGERRKLLLDYCLAQYPDFIVFDNPFDHLDQVSRIELFNQMKALSSKLSIIQLAHQEDSLMPFITKRGYVYDNSFEIHEIPKLANRPGHHMISEFPVNLLTFEKHYDVIVKFDDVSIAYDDQPILKNINWKVKQGEFWQLIGPNGSGKSTLLSLITGENAKAFGQDIIIFDKRKGSGESVWEIKRNIGHFSTSIAELFSRNHTVEHMVLSGFFDSIGLYNKPSGLQLQKATQWLKAIEMIPLKNKIFNKLSLGQQRLILIVRALIKQPPLLILDEPFEGLDHENSLLVAQLLNTIIQKTEVTVIYVSHTVERTLIPSRIYQLEPKKGGSVGRIKCS